MPQDSGMSGFAPADNIDAHWRAAALEQGTHLTRDQARYLLIQHARKSDDDKFWQRLGNHLMDALESMDLRQEVSDAFTKSCPDDIFRTLTQRYTAQRPYKSWSIRSRELRKKKALGSVEEFQAYQEAHKARRGRMRRNELKRSRRHR